ncbi:hypothetical protein JHS3_15890 [Jeongeupia sp. HS-3]|uniref:TauD/TfdA dioxygenase family protein n=1 Tax=Jeongeupia sp. HS-3 TaxID=1009682 RepID=UPI0018A5C85C|nr:TauD/TfdA family dioxygenase [Jeongeupia sp. HS-3]BCL75853.1 hypothetical protein JHS3_15890 [Jeongeupia sp. HS-3]
MSTPQLSRAFHARPDATAGLHTPQAIEEVRITPTGAALGAVVDGLDANRPLSPALVFALQSALDDHHILIFKQQRLDDDAFLSFSTYFGSVFRRPQDVPVLGSEAQGIPPDVVFVSNVETGGYLGSGELTPHADHQWTPLPSAGSLLYALEVPAIGGDTSWYNLNAAYEALDDATRAQIDGLQLITYNPFVRQIENARIKAEGGEAEYPPYRSPAREPLGAAFPHPLVRTHPRSGKKILFLSTHTEVELLGIAPAEGEALIARLREHIVQPRFRYTHRWSVGDIVHWDNQATLHARTAFPAAERRTLKRVSLAGSRPF